MEYGLVDPGVYRRTANGAPVKIALADFAEQPALTLVHEIGHYLDHQAIGTPGKYASRTSSEFDSWRDALLDSAATRRILELWLVPPVPPGHAAAAAAEARAAMRKHLDRMLEEQEAFARAYSQYVALKSRNRRLARELGVVKAFTYPAQWEENDFVPLARELDSLFEGLGWLPNA